MSEESVEKSPDTFSLKDVVFGDTDPVVVQLGALSKLPEKDRNALAWATLEQAMGSGCLLQVVK